MTLLGVCAIVLEFKKARLESKFHPFNTSADAPRIRASCVDCLSWEVADPKTSRDYVRQNLINAAKPCLKLPPLVPTVKLSQTPRPTSHPLPRIKTFMRWRLAKAQP